jgi:hypothetical protein
MIQGACQMGQTERSGIVAVGQILCLRRGATPHGSRCMVDLWEWRGRDEFKSGFIRTKRCRGFLGSSIAVSDRFGWHPAQ